jgi:hypothetical protein
MGPVRAVTDTEKKIDKEKTCRKYKTLKLGGGLAYGCSVD